MRVGSAEEQALFPNHRPGAEVKLLDRSVMTADQQAVDQFRRLVRPESGHQVRAVAVPGEVEEDDVFDLPAESVPTVAESELEAYGAVDVVLLATKTLPD